jgi:kumamolisin
MSERKVFHDSVTTLPEHGGLTATGLLTHAAQPDAQKDKMTLLFALDTPAQDELEERVAKGEVVPAAELGGKYAPKAADVEKLVAWLKTAGFEIVEKAPDQTGVYARGTLEQIEKSLEVQMVKVSKDGFTYNAARNAPSLPVDVGSPVHAILGLQPFRRAHKHFRMRVPKAGNRATLAAHETEQPQPSTNIENAPPYFVGEVLKAYNADGLGLTGAGQTIAILIDTFPRDSDLKSFWKRNGVPGQIGHIEKINVSGAAHLPPIEGEETLDVEWSSGIAPGAKVRIYASGSLSFVDLDRALDRIIADLPSQPGLRQLSISLGLGETFLGGPAGEIATQHQKFLRLAAAGVNVFVSSGDAGSNPSDSGHSATGPTQVEYESSDPCVIGVGGTHLVLKANGDVATETAWPSSGGGKSIFFKRPSWQKGHGVPKGKTRLVPDVSLAADPDTGAFVVLHGSVQQIGGTSWSAPVWAGFCALINEARAKANKPALPFLNPLLYPLLGGKAFRDIDGGSNGAFDSAAGYDMVTGLGVPNVKELIKALV